MVSDEQRAILHALAREGTLSRAAVALKMTPLAVCRRLAGLETALGHPVLQPYGRHIRLTRAAGRLVQELARAGERPPPGPRAGKPERVDDGSGSGQRLVHHDAGPAPLDVAAAVDLLPAQ
ncbi:LysR family transcriptional regulator [Streptomyces sp. NPDC056738]|uniref:helix-turn-helix domain-containing protein n=1 Tax=Streptomyces sp. NPDC056738 TaxID=3345933 RepID=UPI0036BF197D